MIARMFFYMGFFSLALLLSALINVIFNGIDADLTKMSILFIITILGMGYGDIAEEQKKKKKNKPTVPEGEGK